MTRYAKRLDPAGFWEVYEIDTGEVVIDAPLANLEEYQADEVLEVLNNPESFYATDQVPESEEAPPAGASGTGGRHG